MTNETAKPVRIAQIGYGYWGPNLARNFHQMAEAELALVVDANPETLARVRQLYPCQTAVSVDSALDDPGLEAVVVATPARTHFAMVQQALLAGKHVFVEKPLAMS